MFKKLLLTLFSGLLLTTLNLPSAFALDTLESFSPYYGQSMIYKSADYTRIAYERMYWRSGGLVEFDSSNDTYEHEVVFSNYSGEAFGVAPNTGRAFQTNLPNWYVDTQFDDTDGEKNIAIGTYDPTSLQSGTWYYYLLGLDPGAGNSSRYKIIGQDGYAVGNVESPWYVFASYSSKFIPFDYNFLAPENRNYNFEWESNNSMSVASADETWVGEWSDGVIDSTSDVDYWDFTLSSGRNIRFLAKIPSNVDYDFKIFDNNGVQKWTSRAGTGADEIMGSTYFPAGHYYVKVYYYGGTVNPLTTYNFIVY